MSYSYQLQNSKKKKKIPEVSSSSEITHALNECFCTPRLTSIWETAMMSIHRRTMCITWDSSHGIQLFGLIFPFQQNNHHFFLKCFITFPLPIFNIYEKKDKVDIWTIFTSFWMIQYIKIENFKQIRTVYYIVKSAKKKKREMGLVQWHRIEL